MLTVNDLMAVISLCVTFFGLGYSMGSRDNKDTKK